MQTATNPNTGEKVAWNGSDWVPVPSATNPDTGAKAYFIDGQWKEEQAPSLSAQVDATGAVSPKTQDTQEESSYVWDQIKKRYAQYADLFTRVGAGMAYTSQGLTDEERSGFLKLHQGGNLEELESKLGVKDVEPKNDTEKFMGVVGAAAADPLNVLVAPVGVSFKTGNTLFQTTKPYLLTAAEWLTGTAAETTGYYASELTKDLYKGTELEGSVQDHISRFASAFIAGGLTAAASPVRIGQAAAEGAGASRRFLMSEEENVGSLLANTSVKALVDDAIIAQRRSFGDRLNAVERLQQEFPDLVLPLANVAGDNAVIAKEFRRLYSSDVNFRAKYDEALKDIQTQFNVYLQETTRGNVDSVTARSSALAEAGQKRQQNQQQMDRIESARSRVAEKYEEAETSENIVKASDRITESAEKAARTAASLEYEKAFTFAENNGLNFPRESVARMWNAAGGQRSQDLFKDFDKLYSKINRFWSPVEVEKPVIFGPDGRPISGGTSVEFRPASIREMDSLKREINRVRRLTKDPLQRDRLDQLKNVLDQELYAVSPDFAALYKNADSVYFDKVGLPTSLEGFRSLSSARLATQVASLLTKPEQIRDYLNFVGDGGQEVIRDAMLLKARNASMTNGIVNPNKLRSFMARHKESLDLVPNVRRLLEDDVRVVDGLNRVEAKINSRYNVYSLEQGNGFFKTLYQKDLQEASRLALNNNATRQQYLDSIKTLSPETQDLVLRGLRQGMLDQAMTHTNTVFDFITKNREAFSDVFGAEYVDNLSNLGQLADILTARSQDLVAPAIDHARRTGFFDSTGVSIEETIGTLRNQILSTQRKLIHLASKSFVNKSAEKADKALADALLDTKSLQALQREISQLTEALDTSNTRFIGKTTFEFVKKFASTMGGYITAKGNLGAVGSTINNDQLEDDRSMMPSLRDDDSLFFLGEQ